MTPPADESAGAPTAPPLVVFCHLRWDFVYQRPQHVLARLAKTRRVVVIEEPVFEEHYEPWLERLEPAPGVTILRPHTRPTHEGGFSDEQAARLAPLLDEAIEAEGLKGAVVWLYTPMALPLVDRFEPSALVFDVMDELSKFAFAPPQLLQREAELLARADVVFTGGPSLYRAKKDRAQNVHLFPSSVEAEHFRQALVPGGIAEPADQADLPHPRLGFYGVIDERIDLEVVGALARSHPEWQIVMVGPVVKIAWESLPQAPNLHYLGQRTYAELPAYLSGWDVCLLPFARNDSTEFISPTKTVEYMAAERPIVSTPITDVAEPYGEIVYLADTPEAFVAACEAALASSSEEREARAVKMREVLAQTSWDQTAERMGALLEAAVGQPQP